MSRTTTLLEEQTVQMENNLKNTMKYVKELSDLAYVNSDPNYNTAVYQFDSIKQEHDKMLVSSRTFDDLVLKQNDARYIYELSFIVVLTILVLLSYGCNLMI